LGGGGCAPPPNPQTPNPQSPIPSFNYLKNSKNLNYFKFNLLKRCKIKI